MRPIDADALIEKCGDWYVDEGTESGFIGTLKNLLATEPTIQPEKAQLSREGTTSDMISRQAALEAVRTMQTYKLFMGDDMILVDKADVQTELMMLPSVQPERKKGKWLPDNNSVCEMRFICPECKESEVVPTIGFTKYKPIWDFCPNCGAKMTNK